MVPEGEYPSLPTTAKSYYANCICHVHATEGINHYYTYSLLPQEEKNSIILKEMNLTLPDALIDPDTLYAFYSDKTRYTPPKEEETE